MTPEQVFEFFQGKSRAAKALGLTYQALDQWERAKRVPELRQLKIEELTKGKLQRSKEYQNKAAGR